MEYEQFDLLDGLAEALDLEAAALSAEAFDPLTILLDMGQSPAAAANCEAQFMRYTAGVPLVRQHRELTRSWSFLCPDPRCQVWLDGFATAGECRAGWFQHGEERAHDFELAWPADVPYEPVYQMIADPRRGGFSVIRDLVELFRYVDLAGRPITWQDCLCDTAADFRVSGIVPHRTLTAMTCSFMVQCPLCNRGPGFDCDRAFGPAVHTERRAAAAAVEGRRRVDGDLRMPAAWLPELAPTARKPAPAGRSAAALLHVKAALHSSDLFDSLVREMMPLGRMRWHDKAQTSSSILHPDVASAKWMAGLLTGFYGIAETDLTIEKIAPDRMVWSDSSGAAQMTYSHAYDTLAAMTMDTPEAHLAWAAGVVSARHARQLVGDKLRKDDFSTDCGGGTLRNSRQYNNGRAEFSVEWRADGPQRVARKVSWRQVIGVIQGKIPDSLRAEMGEALAEMRGFPLYSDERDRADGWCRDLAMQAWDLVRPDGLVIADQNREVFKTEQESP